MSGHRTNRGRAALGKRERRGVRDLLTFFVLPTMVALLAASSWTLDFSPGRSVAEQDAREASWSLSGRSPLESPMPIVQPATFVSDTGMPARIADHARTASAQGVPIDPGYIGYDGNNVVYPTEYSGNTFLAAGSASSITNTSTGYGTVPSAVVAAWSSAPGYISNYYFAPGYESGDAMFELFMFVSSAGAAGYAPNSPDTGPEYEPGAIYSDVTYSGLAKAFSSSYLQQWNQVGRNTTNGSNPPDTPSTGNVSLYLSLLSAALGVGGVVFPEAGLPLGLAGLALSGNMGGFTDGTYGADSTVACVQSGQGCKYLPDDGTIVEFSQVDNGTFKRTGSPTHGWNDFAQGFAIETDIGPAYLQDITPGYVWLNSVDQLWNTEQGGGYYDAASATLVDPIEPAVSIGGTIDLWPHGPIASNLPIQLQQTDTSSGTPEQTNFDDFTDSGGFWHFFAEPGPYASYDLYADYANGLGTNYLQVPLPASATYDAPTGSNDTGLNYNLDVGILRGSVTSTSGGAISGANVMVYQDVNGEEQGQNAATNSNGDYSLIIPNPATSSAPFDVVVSANKYYANDYTLENVPTGQNTTENFQLTPNPGGGGGGCVASGTPILTPRGYVAVQNLTRGQAIDEFNLTSGEMVTGEIVSANTTSVRGLTDVNSGLLYLTPTDQPIFIRNATFEGWLRDPQNLTTTDQLLDPVTWHWINVTEVMLVHRTATVYDVVTSGLNDFVANGVLLDIKTG
jgi:hypothetical protein